MSDETMTCTIAYVFPNISHHLCLWHIYLNAAKHLERIIQDHPKKFLSTFKTCVYEDRSEIHFKKKWHELLQEYNLGDNAWMKNLYSLKKWDIVFHDSFAADMTATQRSKGMNYVFKKIFCRKLRISELLVEFDKVTASLHANELDEDFRSRHNDQVTYIPNLPMLKTATESYTRRMYSEFQAEFKDQFYLVTLC
jgi:zinc finger SWIM domain-containing protein 3